MTDTEKVETLAAHDHGGPDSQCSACAPLADVLRRRMTWASVHWGGLHDDAYPSLSRAVVTSEWLAELIARERAEALREAARYFEYDMAPAWGGEATWISTGSHVADLVGQVLRERADELSKGGDDR